MKKTLSILFSILSLTIMAQVPQGVGYQGVATDANGIELVNQSISIRASVLSGSANGTIEWEETHTTITDTFGLFTLTIGQGTNTTNGAQASFADISWGTNTHFLKIEMDVTGGTNYSFMGTNQMMSVPYALYAESANINYDSISNILSNDSTFITTVGGGIGGGGCDLNYPDGLSGEIIDIYISSSINNNYTVPTGKRLYISRITGNGGLDIDGVVIYDDLGSANYPNPRPLISTIVVNENQTISIYQQTSGIRFIGMLVDASVSIEPISYSLSSNYTIPTSKILVITYVNRGTGSIQLNGNGLIQLHENIFTAFPLESGGVLDGSGSFNGYLVDENYFAGCGGGSSSTIPSGGTPGSVLIIDINGNPTWSNTYLSVGDNWAGGIIAHVFQPGTPGYIEGETHGYVVHPMMNGDFPQNQGFGMGWGCDGIVTGINNSNLGEGYNNTALIASQCPIGTAGVWTNTISHAKFWNDLNDGGYDDWFMPNSAEALLLDSSVLPSAYFYISEEVIQGECSYCDPAYVARAWNTTQANFGIDWLNKDAGGTSIGIREF